MSIEAGTYELGPQSGSLSVRTGKTGPAAKAGHNLLIEVGQWSAKVAIADDPAQNAIELTADSHSLKVLEGSGGMTTLSDEDKGGIAETIDQEVLKGTAISFRSTAVTPGGDDSLAVDGDLSLWGKTSPVRFQLTLADDGHLTATTTIKQSSFGQKPYSALFGTLKVTDEVEISVDARLHQSL